MSDEDDRVNPDRLNTVRDLLRKTFQAQLAHRGISWQHEEHLFVFVDPEGRDVRREEWSAGRSGGKIVYQIHRQSDDTSKVWYHEHLAFEAGFDLYDGAWFLSVNPTWFCSYDGYRKSRHHRNRVSFLKRNDHNNDVLTNLLFITEILRKDQTEELLDHGVDGPRIVLGELEKLGGASPISDDAWLQQDEKRKRKALAARAEPAVTSRRPSRRKATAIRVVQAELFGTHES